MQINPIFDSSVCYMTDANNKALVIITVGSSDERLLLVAVDRKTSIHLTREQVGALIPLLQHFVDTGELPLE